MNKENKKCGWIKIYRSITDHWVYKNKPFCRFAAWIDLILLANHNQNKFLLGNRLVECQRGELITSEKKLMARWGWSKAKVRNFLKTLQNDSMIDLKPDQKKTTVKIHHYSDYQDIETAKRPLGDHSETTRRPLRDPNKKKEEYKNEKKKKKREKFTPPSIEIITMYFQEKGLTGNIGIREAKIFENYYIANGWMVGRNKMIDWKATVRGWVLRRENGKINYSHPNPQSPSLPENPADDKEKEIKKYKEMQAQDHPYQIMLTKVTAAGAITDDEIKSALDKPGLQKFKRWQGEFDELEGKYKEVIK